MKLVIFVLISGIFLGFLMGWVIQEIRVYSFLSQTKAAISQTDGCIKLLKQELYD